MHNFFSHRPIQCCKKNFVVLFSLVYLQRNIANAMAVGILFTYDEISWHHKMKQLEGREKGTFLWQVIMILNLWVALQRNVCVSHKLVSTLDTWSLRACSAVLQAFSAEAFAVIHMPHSVTSLPTCANLPVLWGPTGTHGPACLLSSTPAESWVNGGASSRTTDLKMCRQALWKSPLLHCLTSSICFFG